MECMYISKPSLVLKDFLVVFHSMIACMQPQQKKYIYEIKEFNETHFNTGDIVLFNTKGYCNKFTRNIIKISMFYSNKITGDD